MKNTYIGSYSRTPIGSFRGSLSSIPATKLGSCVINDVLEKIEIKKENVDEVIMGNVLSANLGQAPARQAALGANLNYQVECMTINKVCGSGLKAVMLADQSIKIKNSNVVIAGGMENMSRAPHYLDKSRGGTIFGHSTIIDSILKDGLWDPYNNFAMGNCAEQLCKENKYTRETQDEYALMSYERANHAIKNGLFENEICNVEVKNRKKISIIDQDEEPLKFNASKLSKLRPAFDKEGTITAANASSLSDGAASILLLSEDFIKKENIKPKAKIVGHTSFAMEPIYFTKAPVYAIKKLLKETKINLNDIDLFEINEAFSCVAMYAIDELKLNKDKVNINGGAVSLGHPIGASGTRILVTLVNALCNKGLKYGVACLCIGGGEASAILIENCE